MIKYLIASIFLFDIVLLFILNNNEQVKEDIFPFEK